MIKVKLFAFKHIAKNIITLKRLFKNFQLELNVL